jgi:hypothetical protein
MTVTHHVVAAGDTLSAIARANGVTLGALRVANRGLDLTALYPGDVLHIPPRVDTTPPPPPPPPPPVDPLPTTGTRYRQGFGYYPNFHNKAAADGSGNTFAKVNAFTAALGGLPDLFMVSADGGTGHEYGSAVWGQFVDPDRAYLPSMAGEVGVEVLVPLNPDGGSQWRAVTVDGRAQIRVALQAVANGRDDDLHRQQAQRLVAAGYPDAVLRIGSECDMVNWGSAAYHEGNDDVYRAAYRRVVDVFRSVSSDFEFCWTILSHTWVPEGFPSHVFLGYPGDDHVDYCGMDIYFDNPTPPTDADLAIYRARLVEHAAFAADHGKRVCYPEWAQTGHDDPRYFRFMTAWHAELGDRLGYANYFASGGGEGGNNYDPRSYPTLWAAFVDHYGK